MCAFKHAESSPSIQCSLCASWFHFACVDLDPSTATAIWPCGTCRKTPKLVADLVTNIGKINNRLDKMHDSNQELISALSRKKAQCSDFEIQNIRLAYQIKELELKCENQEKALLECKDKRSLNENSSKDVTLSDEINSECLLIGSSIVGAPGKLVPEEVEVITLPGANIKRVTNEVSKLKNRKQKYSRVIVHAGSINRSDHTPEEICNQYGELLEKVKDIAVDRVTISGILPRSDGRVDPEVITEVNTRLEMLSDNTDKCDFNDHSNNFTYRNGRVVEGMLHDGLHLTQAGAVKFLDNLGLPVMLQDKKGNNNGPKWNKVGRNGKKINNNTEHYKKDGQGSDAAKGKRTPSQASHNSQPYCFFCGETGHISSSCGYNSRLKCWGCGRYGHKQSLCRN